MAREIVEQVKVKGPGGKTGSCILYSDGTIRIDWVRFSYPHLKKAHKKEGDQGEAKFGLTSILYKATHAKAHALISKRIQQLLTDNKVKKLGADRLFLRDGDEGDRPEHEDAWTISAREARRPPLRDRANTLVDPDEVEETFQPGYWGTVLIRPWYQNNSFGKRVNAGLSSVQFVKKDETFGEGRLSEEDLDDTFDSYDDEDDDGEDGYESKPKRSSKKPTSRRSRDEDDDDDDI